MSFDKFLEDFKTRKPEWFKVGSAPAIGHSVRLEASQAEPAKRKFQSSTVPMGDQMDQEANDWHKKNDLKMRAAGNDDDIWDAKED